jgi:hypothetical protein
MRGSFRTDPPTLSLPFPLETVCGQLQGASEGLTRADHRIRKNAAKGWMASPRSSTGKLESQPRLVRYLQPSKGNTEGKGPGTFDFLGFTLYCCRSRRG